MLRGLDPRFRNSHLGHFISHGLTTRLIVRFQSAPTAAAQERRKGRLATSFIPKRTSPQLRELLGENREVMSEREAIFRIRVYCLQHCKVDPTDKQYWLCDEQVGAVLGLSRIHRQRLYGTPQETLLFSHLESMDDDEHKTAWAIPRVAKLLGTQPASGEEAVRELYAYAKGRGLQDPKQKRHVLSDDAMKAAGFGTKVDMHQWVHVLREFFEE